MPKPILNIADVDFRKVGTRREHARRRTCPEKFSARVGDIGRRLGAQKLGYNLTVVPAGKRAWPFHNHRVNEEMFFVLEGEGEVRIGNETLRSRQAISSRIRPAGPRPRTRSSTHQSRLEVSRRQHGDNAGNLRLSGLRKVRRHDGRARSDGKPKFWRFAARDGT